MNREQKIARDIVKTALKFDENEVYDDSQKLAKDCANDMREINSMFSKHMDIWIDVDRDVESVMKATKEIGKNLKQINKNLADILKNRNKRAFSKTYLWDV